jgi:hypothetical protein
MVMKLEKLKEYLQNYFDTVITPRFLEEPNDDGIESFTVYNVVKGSYQPPIIHVFIDSLPINNHPLDSTKSKLRQMETDVKDFIKMFSVKNPVKVHLNKRPLFKKGKSYSVDL